MSKRLAHHRSALDIMRKAHALGDSLRESGFRRAAQETVTDAYVTLIAGQVATRAAAVLTGLVRATPPWRPPHPRGVGVTGGRAGQQTDRPGTAPGPGGAHQ